MANVITQEWDFLELLGKKYLVSYIYICRKNNTKHKFSQ